MREKRPSAKILQTKTNVFKINKKTKSKQNQMHWLHRLFFLLLLAK